MVEMEKKYSRTNIFIIDSEVWNWAKYRANELDHNSVSEYLFKLIELDRNGWTVAPELLKNDLIPKVDNKEDGS